MFAHKFGELLVSACLVGLLLAAPAPAKAAGTLIKVNTLDDYGHTACSLRAAILAANLDAPVDGCPAGNGTDTIRVPAGLYVLHLTEPGEEQGQDGDLDILQDVIIKGAGKEKTIIEPREYDAHDRILQVHAGAVVEMRGLQIRRANLVEQEGVVKDLIGGGIYNAGALRLKDVILMQNHAGGNGGGIYNTGSLEVTDTRLVNNSADYGGAISNHGTLTILRGKFTANSGTDGGAIQNAAGAQATITETDFIENLGPGRGGAIDQLGQMTLRKSEFWRNRSEEGAGGLHNWGSLLIEDCLFNGNDSSFDGGAITQEVGRLTVRRTQVVGNFGLQGGLFIKDTQDTLVEDSLFSRNSAYHGPGIRHLSGPTTILNSTFENNGSYSGAGLQVEGSDVYISGCTIHDNGTSDEGGSGILITGEVLIENTTITGNHGMDDGAVYIVNGSATLRNTTIVRNEGIGVRVSGGTITFESSIIAENHREDDPSVPHDCILVGDEPTGQIISLGHNLVGTTRECPWPAAQGDLLGSGLDLLDPQLEDLADNGGPTRTHALMPGSPAIDAAGTACPPVDQRGVPRPAGPACDIGAFELAAASTVTHTIHLPVIHH